MMKYIVSAAVVQAGSIVFETARTLRKLTVSDCFVEGEGWTVRRVTICRSGVILWTKNQGKLKRVSRSLQGFPASMQTFSAHQPFGGAHHDPEFAAH